MTALRRAVQQATTISVEPRGDSGSPPMTGDENPCDRRAFYLTHTTKGKCVMTRAKGKAQEKHAAETTLPTAITTEKDKELFRFSLAMNLVPMPYRPLGRKHLPLIKTREQMVEGAYYWVRMWHGALFQEGNWALCEYANATEDGGMRLLVIAAAGRNDEGMEAVVIHGDANAFGKKMIRLAQEWTPVGWEGDELNPTEFDAIPTKE
jgi:hypothetical protein